VEVVERLHEILGASSPTRQLGDEDGVDVACLGESHHLLALNAIVLGARGGLLEDTDDFEASAPGKCAEITFLALAGLVVGADPAVDGDLSQLIPSEMELRKRRKYTMNASKAEMPSTEVW